MDIVSESLMQLTESEVVAAWSALRDKSNVVSAVLAISSLNPCVPTESSKSTAASDCARMALSAVVTGAKDTRAGAHVPMPTLRRHASQLTQQAFVRAVASYVVWCGQREILDSSLVAQALPTIRSFSEERAILRELASDRSTFFGWIPRDICSLIDALLHVRAGQHPGRVGEHLEFGGVVLSQEQRNSATNERLWFPHQAQMSKDGFLYYCDSGNRCLARIG